MMSVIMYVVVLFSTLLVINNAGVEGLDKFNQDILDTHNFLRAGHNVPPLKWSRKLARNAQKWVNELKRTSPDTFPPHPHSPEDGNFRVENDGENYSWQLNSKLQPGSTHVLAWYTEIFDYERQNPVNNGAMIGHFTQIVWKDTTQVGCGRATSTVDWHGMELFSTHVICQYHVGGNMRSYFPEKTIEIYDKQVPTLSEGSCMTMPGSCDSETHCIAYGPRGRCSCPRYKAVCEASNGCVARCQNPGRKYPWTDDCKGERKCECTADGGAVCQ